MSTRDKLQMNVQCYSFAVTEAMLFLDTHPDCSEALAYYNKYKKLYEEAKAAYEEKYGPLSVMSNANSEKWQWATDPWPWELSENEEA